jgi:plasmid stabilization system protein ParE
MRIVFLASTKPDLRWYKRYYTTAFPDGRDNADRQFKAALVAILATPRVGHPSQASPEAREFVIPRTPFLLVYRIRDQNIEILRLRDARGER